MSHMKNIKEMLSIPTGNRNGATSGYSSFTDSQFFFGSQFWPENSQGASQEMSLSSRTSQQSSQEGSDPKSLTSYQNKPLLFGELKDKSKAFGMLDKFEEDKKRAKEKADSDIFAKEFHHFRETLNNIQQLVAGTEGNTAVCQTVLEKFDIFASTLQSNVNSLQNDISQKFESLLNKVNSQKEKMTELGEAVQKSGDATSELGSNLQSLKNSLECLRKAQEREGNMLEEALKLLSTLVSEQSAKPSSETGVNSAIQTSPRFEQSFCSILQDNKLKGTKLTCMSRNLEHKQAEVPPQNPSCITGKRKSSLRSNRRHKKRPLVLSRSKRPIITDENSQPLINCNQQHNVLNPACDLGAVTSQDSLNCPALPNREMRPIGARCFITPFSCWSQDSNSSVCLAGIEPILDTISAESRTGNPGKPQGFWQLFDMDCDSD